VRRLVKLEVWLLALN